MIAGNRRELLAGGAAALMAGLAGRALAAVPDPYAGIDPEMVDDLRLRGEMDVSAATLAAFRTRPAAPHAHPVPPPMTVDAQVRMLPGLPGEPPVKVLVIDPAPARAARPRPAVIWMHGGGFVSGGAGVPAQIVPLAAERGWLIVSVDYRLAPEARWAASVNDNYAALRWVHQNAATLRVDPARVAVGGSSAGGGHAAMLALAARDRRELPPLAYQALIYPMLDDRTGSTRPGAPDTGRFVWTAASNRFGWSSILGRPSGGADVPVLAVPGRRSDLAGLPPAFVGVGTLDLFLGEDLAYATALAAAGVRTDLGIVPGAYHGFDGIAPAARASRAFTARWTALLAQALG